MTMTPTEIDQLVAINALAWADLGNMQLGADTFQTEGFEFLHEPYQSTARRRATCKCTQQGWTQMEVIRVLHKMIYRIYKKGGLYLFPTRDDVTDFSSSRFKPMIVDNPGLIGRYLAETDRANLKRIGDAFLYFRGARLGNKSEGGVKKAQQLKSIPADIAIFDELDEMDQAAIEFALQRLADSDLKEEAYLGNPTIPNYGIDAKFQESDQRYYHLKCQSCGALTCLEREFPSCLMKRAGKSSGPSLIINKALAGQVYRACIKCGAEVFTRDGVWIPKETANSEFMHGYTLSHLNSRNQDPAELLNEYNEATATGNQKKLTSINNLRLGRAYIAAENQLRKTDVLACCGMDPMMVSHQGPCAAGVDVGATFRVVIGHRLGAAKLKVVKLERVSTFNDVYDLMKRFHVRSAVFDLYPEIHSVRDFCNKVPFQCFGCEYSDSQHGMAAWDEKSKTIKVNRTELLDATHDLVVTPGAFEIPRTNDEVDFYAEEMTHTAKVLEEDEDTGSKKYRYKGKVGGRDDYRHATNYFKLACTRIQPIVYRTAPRQEKREHYYG